MNNLKKFSVLISNMININNYNTQTTALGGSVKRYKGVLRTKSLKKVDVGPPWLCDTSYLNS